MADSPLQALRHASVASKGEQDFRNDKADGVKRKEFEEDEEEHEVEEGKLERVLGVTEWASTEASDSELASD